MKSQSRWLHCTFVLFFACLLLAQNYQLVIAQDLDDVTISGRITDQNGAVVPGATVTAILITENQERVATTDAEGRYRFVELRPGAYTIRVKAAGFADAEQRDLIAISGQNLQLSYALTPAGISAETVIVSQEAAPAVDTTRTIVGGTVTQREIEELPNVNRNPYDVVFTLGGVTEEPLSTRDIAEDRGQRGDSAPRNTPEEAGIFALSGGAAYSNNITIDGFDNNDDRAATFRFQPSIESIDEVQVVTNQFSAEYGRASGGRVNLRTRGGTTDWRGRVYYFFNDESLNANTWRNNSRGIPRSALQRNIPGFTFGGPVPLGYFKNKTFFFAAFEYDQTSDTAVTDTFVPAAQNPRFALPASTDASIAFTDANQPLARYLVETETPRQNRIFTARIDHNFTDAHNITVSYQLGRTRDQRVFTGGNTLPAALFGRARNTDAINFTDNLVLDPRLVNQFRFQYSQLEPTFQAAAQAADSPVVLIGFSEPVDLANPNGARRATTLVAGSSSLGASDRREKRWQFQDSVNIIAGTHTIKFGSDVQKVNSTFVDLTDASGTFTFAATGSGNSRVSGVTNFLNNRPTRFRQNFFTASTQNNTYIGAFVQDEWRLRSNLTLSAGLRYERETIVDDKNNFGPRFAVAYNPFRDDKGVIRFGAGVFYNRVLLRTIDDFSRGSSSIEFDSNRVPVTSTAAGRFSREQYLQQLSVAFPNQLTSDHSLVQRYINEGYNEQEFFRRLDPDLQVPESYQFNLGFEREIGADFVLEANATYNRTARLWREFNANAPRVPTGFDTLTDYLLSRDFNNARDPRNNNQRPIYNVSAAGDLIRFQLTPFNNQDVANVTINRQRLTIVNLASLSTSASSGSPLGIAASAVRFLRPIDPNVGQIEQVASIGNSKYRGLVLELRRRYRRLGFGFGTSFRAAYTFSKLEDDGIVNTSSAQTVGDFSAEFSRSLLDRRHRFAFSGVFDTPSWFGKLRLSPLLRLASSAPFNVSLGGEDEDDRNLDDVSTDRPNFSGNVEDIRYREPGESLNSALQNAFTLAPIGSPGNLPRNAGKGPSVFIFDLSVSRLFQFGEGNNNNRRFALRPSIEFDKVLNSTVFSFGSEFINSTAALGQSSAEFVQSDFLVARRALRPRQVRFGIRFDF